MPDESIKQRFRRRCPQYLAAISACMSGFSLGSCIGWSAPCVEVMKANYNQDDFSTNVIAASLPLGAALGIIPVPFLIDRIGRKWMLVVIVPPFILGWIFIIAAVPMIGPMVAGRLITGACGGMVTVAAPLYTAEISEKDIRGTLSVFFQLLIVLGILYAYCCGFSRDVVWTSILCGITPIIFGCAMLYMPESPLFLLAKDNEEGAKKAMRFLRGPDADFTTEIAAMKEQIQLNKDQKGSLRLLVQKRMLKTLGLAYGLMFAQQLSGINAVIFYSETIFKQTDVDMVPLHQMVVFAVVQVISCIVSALLIDKLGRKFLVILSISMMCVCMQGLGTFFILKSQNSEHTDNLLWLPLTSACIYILGFCLGAGPVPWTYMSEIFPTNVKGIGTSSAAFFNWLLAFTVTVTFSTAVEFFGIAALFFFFSVVCLFSALLLFFFMIETKGKTFIEIQREMGSESN